MGNLREVHDGKLQIARTALDAKSLRALRLSHMLDDDDGAMLSYKYIGFLHFTFPGLPEQVGKGRKVTSSDLSRQRTGNDCDWV